MQTCDFSSATPSIFKALKNLCSCAQYGHYGWIERKANPDCDYPIRIRNPFFNPDNWRSSTPAWLPDPSVKKVFVVRWGDREKSPWYAKPQRVLTWIFQFVPQRHTLDMKSYKVITFQIGSATNGFSVAFQIPSKFSYKD